MTVSKHFFHTILAVFLVLGAVPSAQAQGPFDIVVRVNERIITQYELEQRALFLKALGTAGNLTQESTDRLIDERLYLDAAERLGISVEDEAINQGMIEFAGRAKLEPEEFIQAMAEEGIDVQTFRDFVASGILWREVVGTLFGQRGRVSEAEVDRALSLSSQTGGVRVLLGEIVLPADTPENQERAAVISAEIQKITSTKVFSEAATAVSVSQSAPNGGQLDWLSLADLPPAFRPLLLTLAPGEITDPIEIPNALLFFQMRAIQETAAPIPTALAVEYARLYLPGGRAPNVVKQAMSLRYTADSCDDLYGLYPNSTEEQLEIISQAQSDVPSDIAVELAKLDEGEVSANLTRNDGQTLVVLMLCGRTAEIVEDETRNALRTRLINERVTSYADAYLAELRATALIREP
ncbi:SurA N-terminal domain-containing protein [Falsihalocynthiibacter sp. S25ZX9]|uniref:SurA N-terminal domain-containing protein n=1 Tax=Falsihalocynthiibacter sp. S25ZX9 TaxID=3240870 RepID=UPI00350EFB64